MKFRFDAMLYSNLVNENSDAGDMKCLRVRRFPIPAVYEYALYSAFQLQTQEIGRSKVKIYKLWSQNFQFLGQKLVAPSHQSINSQAKKLDR